MNDTQTQTQTAPDPLDEKCGGDISFPLLKEKIYPKMRIADISVGDSKSEDAVDGAKTMAIKLALTEQALDVRDEVLQPGFAVTQYLGVTPTGKRTAANIK